MDFGKPITTSFSPETSRDWANAKYLTARSIYRGVREEPGVSQYFLEKSRGTARHGTARHGTARHGTAGITPAMQQRERREVKDSEIRSEDCSYYYDAVLSVGRYARRFWKSQNSDLEIDLMAVMV
ncbi:hypothetical protein V1477_017570 [Vespula maculifrons]|uniref:Uncharacterized protein n=1 Tax=Vespula maculifrons TaxID=7453 RepID=A0ABD2B6F7_VESMC